MSTMAELEQYSKTLLAERKTGVCRNGHTISSETDIVNQRGYKLCRACREAWREAHPATSRMCRNGLHRLEPGQRRCGRCAEATKRRTQLAKDPVRSFKFTSFPPDEVLVNAACSPELAYLFDPVEGPGNLKGVERDRIDSAKAVCAACPVAEACFADAVRNRRYGVWGGRYLFPKWYEKNSALVQSVKSRVA